MTITTQADLALAIPAAKNGDTLVLEGTFDSLPLKVRPDDLTLDCTKATITGSTYTKGLNGCAFIGGLWTGVAPIRVDGGRDITIKDAVMIGPPERTGKALSFQDVNGITVSGTSLKDYHDGIGLTRVDHFGLVDVGIEGMGQDGVHLLAVWNGVLRGVIVHGTRRFSPTTHGDACQILSLPGIKPTANLLFEDCEAYGDIQGILTTLKSGDGGFDNIALRRCRTRVAFSNGIEMAGVRGLTIEDCHVSTYPMALYPSKLYVAPSCTDVQWVGELSTQAGYRNKSAMTWGLQQ